MHDPLPSSDHQPNLPNLPVMPLEAPPRRVRGGSSDRYEMAKWPPDDMDMPGGGIPGQPMGGGGGGPIGPYDSDFRRGRFNPKLVSSGFSS